MLSQAGEITRLFRGCLLCSMSDVLFAAMVWTCKSLQSFMVLSSMRCWLQFSAISHLWPNEQPKSFVLYYAVPATVSHWTHITHLKLVCAAMQKQTSPLFQRGVMNLDLSSAFGQLRHKLGNCASGLENVEAMAIDSAVEDVNRLSRLCTSRSRSVSGLLLVILKKMAGFQRTYCYDLHASFAIKCIWCLLAVVGTREAWPACISMLQKYLHARLLAQVQAW